MSYQRHAPSQSSTSDSIGKLTRLQLPTDMTGMRFLDIGCNEGFFCNVAAQRGATVVGIDNAPSAIAFARERYPNPAITFLCQNWDRLPEGPFDVILWASAMHYELAPRRILEMIHSRLRSNGLFILECGASQEAAKEMIQVSRPTDIRYYPTVEFLLNHLLSGFAVRQVAEWEAPQWDPIPRSVFHCQRSLPVVLLLCGPSGQGKTILARRVQPAVDQIISIDTLIGRIISSEYQHDEVQKFIKKNADINNLEMFIPSIDCSDLTVPYVRMLVDAISTSSELAVIDGFMTRAQVAELHRQMAGRSIIWEARRI